MRLTVPAVVLAVLTLAGCSAMLEEPPSPSPTSSAISNGCREALIELQNVAVDEEGDPFDSEDAAIAATTEACSTVAEYVAAVEENPASWFYDDSDEVAANVDLLIISACLENRERPMCVDAEANSGYDFDSPDGLAD